MMSAENDSEKREDEQLEARRGAGIGADKEAYDRDADVDGEFEDDEETAAEERRLVRKLDGRILPIACLMYLCACAFFSFSNRRPC